MMRKAPETGPFTFRRARIFGAQDPLIRIINIVALLLVPLLQAVFLSSAAPRSPSSRVTLRPRDSP